MSQPADASPDPRPPAVVAAEQVLRTAQALAADAQRWGARLVDEAQRGFVEAVRATGEEQTPGEEERLPGAALIVRPGDRVLIAVAGNIGLIDAERYRGHLERRFPGVEFTIAADVAALAVQPADDPDAAGEGQ